MVGRSGSGCAWRSLRRVHYRPKDTVFAGIPCLWADNESTDGQMRDWTALCFPSDCGACARAFRWNARNGRGVASHLPRFQPRPPTAPSGLASRDEVGCGFDLTLGVAIVASYVNETDDHGAHEQGDARRSNASRGASVDVPERSPSAPIGSGVSAKAIARDWRRGMRTAGRARRRRCASLPSVRRPFGRPCRSPRCTGAAAGRHTAGSADQQGKPTVAHAEVRDVRARAGISSVHVREGDGRRIRDEHREARRHQIRSAAHGIVGRRRRRAARPQAAIASGRARGRLVANPADRPACIQTDRTA